METANLMYATQIRRPGRDQGQRIIGSGPRTGNFFRDRQHHSLAIGEVHATTRFTFEIVIIKEGYHDGSGA